MLIVIQNYGLKEIVGSVEFLLDRAAHSIEVRDLAVQIVGSSGDAITDIYDWERKNLKYLPDPVQAGGDIELFISPIKMANDYKAGLQISGDCDDFAILTTSLLRAVGTWARVVIIDQSGNGLDHAYCEAWSDILHDWVNIDATTDFPLGWKYQYRDIVMVQ